MKDSLHIGIIILLSLMAVFLWRYGRPILPIQPIEQIAPISVPTPTTTPLAIPTFKSLPVRKLDGGRLFNLVNDYRIKNGLRALEWYHPLCEYSKRRSEQVKEDFSHTTYFASLNQFCQECSMTGENLAKNYSTEEQVLSAWIASPGHKENLDGDWDWACAMFYFNNYVSMIFGKRK